jgi:hypothetical protein
MKTIYAKPADGLRVRKEDNPQFLVKPEGEELPATTYYRRRVIAGDLVEFDPAGKSGGKPAKTGKES